MVNLVLSSNLLFQVKTAYRINYTHENDRVEVKKSNLGEKGFLCYCKIAFLKKRVFQPLSFFLSLIIDW